MTHLAASPFVTRPASRAERGSRAPIPLSPDLGSRAFALPATPQNFLENACAAPHYSAMGETGAIRPTGTRPPTADREARNILDTRVAFSVYCCATDERAYLNATSAWTEKSHADGRMSAAYARSIKHTMIGNPAIANAQHHRFGENIHAKYQKSAAVAPILHQCALESCVAHSRPMHDGGWVDLYDCGATPNERSGR